MLKILVCLQKYRRRDLPDIRVNASSVITSHQHVIDVSTISITSVFDVSKEITERSVQDPDPTMTMVVPRETTHTILEGTTQRLKRKLVDIVKRYRPIGIVN